MKKVMSSKVHLYYLSSVVEGSHYFENVPQSVYYFYKSRLQKLHVDFWVRERHTCSAINYYLEVPFPFLSTRLQSAFYHTHLNSPFV